MGLCPATSPLDWIDPCIRATWFTLVPAALAILYLLSSVLPTRVRRKLFPLHTFLPLKEAEAYDADEPYDGETSKEKSKERCPLWVTIVLGGVGLMEMVAWTAVGSYKLSTLRLHSEANLWSALRPLIIAATWLYATVKPAIRPKATPPYDLFVLYIVHFLGAVETLGSAVFDHEVYSDPLPHPFVIAAYSLHLTTVLGLLIVVLSRPVGIPSDRVDKSEIGKSISPEEYTSLFGWISFSWVTPLIKRGTYQTLNEEDVWKMTPTIAAKPCFAKFSKIKRKSLLRQLWIANHYDIIWDFLLTVVSVIFNYAGPFFLKRILDAIDNPTVERRAQAYLLAFAAFCCMVLKAEADVQHLWFGRRAATRIRAELMSAVYEKALKRRDFSGIVNKDGKDKKDESSEPSVKKSKSSRKEEKKRKEEKAKADDPKAGADIGKIVNLMSADSNRVAMLVSGMYFLYGAPLEIIIASTFLYQLLGWSAFAGFAFLFLSWPLNSYLSRRSIRITKGLLAARDKRMGILNELISAVKFIKFFAWEDRWIARALEARKKELDWLVKSRFNSIMFGALWSTAPIMVSVLSFACFVWQGNELTVGTAFTAIALFNMIRSPLGIIPNWIIQILQTRVAMQRIETFLNEDEVDEQVSSLKRTNMGRDAPHYDEFGLRNASFKWNVVKEAAKEDKNASKKVNGKNVSPDSSVVSPAERDVEGEAEASSLTSPDPDRIFELANISVVFPDGELTVVTGPTASGKTALLLALLGEMTKIDGEILMSKEPDKVDEFGLKHAISYAAQTPWLQHQSIKENILFGSPYEEERYKQVVECCALLPDLRILEDGDETEIGARGVSLSGGQKARVALARAVYARTKYVLLDDPLSAVDSHTSRFLYERLFLGPLMRHRTVVLVTHHVELVLPGTYYLIRMLDGHIDCQGTVKELRAQGLLDSIAQSSELEAKESEKDDEAKVEEDEEAKAKAAVEAVEGESGTQTKQKKPRKLIKDEMRETGGVKWSIYRTYLKASSYWTWVILFSFICINQILGVVEKYWIMIWGEAYGSSNQSGIFSHLFVSSLVMDQASAVDAQASPYHFNNHPHGFAQPGLASNLPSAQEHPFFYVGVYACIGFASVLVSISSAATQYTGALRASKILFRQLLVAVVRATMRWHDVTPTGRMLNRFGKDIETVDSSLASSLQAVNASLANFFSSMVVVVFVFPWFLLPAIFIGFFYYRLAIGYLNTGRDLRRMESTARSPIFSGFGELLEGIVTVRAFSAEARFLNGLFKKVDLTLQMWYNFWMTNRWLLLRFDCLGALGVLLTTLFSLSGYVRAGIAGLCITSAMAFTTNIYWACRFWTTLELDLNSVERVVEYLDLPQEPPAIIENARPPAHWPSSTGPNSDNLIVVEDLEIRYAPDLPAVLHDVSFSLKARERIGLLGRTGSGKSTLAMSILRFVDPTKGKIIIDGIDITTIGLHDLRSRITFIPQDATLFSGTLRDNLDPFGDYSDLECLDALYRVQMLTDRSYHSQRSSRAASRAPSIHGVEREETDATAVEAAAETHASSSSSSAQSIVSNSPTATAADFENGSKTPTQITLETEVSAGGLNFSAGQRQLIAMARALLRQSAIIVLDEATSSIDFETDAKIQKTIREEFSGSLLLTVAHRLRTVIDYDRLIVLDSGHVAEFDTPYNLIKKEGGIFRSMCLKSGTYVDLEEAARKKHEGL